jgi:nucleoside-diphosphate-sugar epimerase
MSLRGRRVLVTGGTGFIGCRLVEKLALEHGAAVRVLVRRFASAARVARLDVDIVHGDVTDPAAVASAMQGCDIVVHCAYGNDGDADQQRAVYVEGSRIVAEKALEAGVGRMVHVSTIAVYGTMPDGDVDERTPFGGPGDHYSRTKREAEDIVTELHRRAGLPLAIVRPTCVYGPYGLAFTIDPLRRLREGQVVLVNGGEGLCNAIYVDDLVHGILLAAVEPAALGEVFHLTGASPLTWRDFYAAYERLLGKRSTVSMTVGEARARARGDVDSRTFPSEDMLAFYAARPVFRIDKAKRLLGFDPAFDFERGMELTAQWARWAGLVPGAPRH